MKTVFYGGVANFIFTNRSAVEFAELRQIVACQWSGCYRQDLIFFQMYMRCHGKVWFRVNVSQRVFVQSLHGGWENVLELSPGMKPMVEDMQAKNLSLGGRLGVQILFHGK